MIIAIIGSSPDEHTAVSSGNQNSSLQAVCKAMSMYSYIQYVSVTVPIGVKL